MNRGTYFALIGLAALGGTAVGFAGYYKLRADQYRTWWQECRQRLDAATAALPAPPPPRAPRAEPSASPSAPPATEAAPAAGAVVPAESSALQARIRELEAALREKERALAALPPTPDSPPSTNRPRSRFNGPQWLEQIKENDPERYKQIQDARAAAEKRVDDAFARTSGHLLARDTASMNEQEKASYDLMIQLLTETWELSEKLRADLSRDERREAFQALREKTVALTPLLEAERQREFYELGIQIGYSRNDATQFVGYLNEVIAATTPQPMFGGLGRGLFGGRGGTNASGRASGATNAVGGSAVQRMR